MLDQKNKFNLISLNILIASLLLQEEITCLSLPEVKGLRSLKLVVSG